MVKLLSMYLCFCCCVFCMFSQNHRFFFGGGGGDEYCFIASLLIFCIVLRKVFSYAMIV